MMPIDFLIFRINIGSSRYYLMIKSMVCVGLFGGISMLSSEFNETLSFLLLDTLLSVYLCSFFRTPWRLLFLIHPVFVYISAIGFQMPFTEIGTAFTYIQSYRRFVDPITLTIRWEDLIFAITHYSDRSYYGYSSVYPGVIPFLWFRDYLFPNSPEITAYYSMSLWALVCTGICVNVAMFQNILRSELLLIIALYATVSPTFFDINSVIHRYHLLFVGLFLFLIGYVGITRKRSEGGGRASIVAICFGIIFVGVSKQPLYFSLALFVFLDYCIRGKISVFTRLGNLKSSLRVWIIMILIVTTQIIAANIVPEKYSQGFSQQGGQYTYASNIPIIGLIFRLTYAALSPFPWSNFAQWELYGYNECFLIVHILSALLSSWLIISLFMRAKRILNGPDDIRLCVTFGVAIMASLAFSAIGFHVYLAPALPFLATLAYEPLNRIGFIYPVIFTATLEVMAQIAQILR